MNKIRIRPGKTRQRVAPQREAISERAGREVFGPENPEIGMLAESMEDVVETRAIIIASCGTLQQTADLHGPCEQSEFNQRRYVRDNTGVVFGLIAVYPDAS